MGGGNLHNKILGVKRDSEEQNFFFGYTTGNTEVLGQYGPQKFSISS